jgi:hypothetical protein
MFYGSTFGDKKTISIHREGEKSNNIDKTQKRGKANFCNETVKKQAFHDTVVVENYSVAIITLDTRGFYGLY